MLIDEIDIVGRELSGYIATLDHLTFFTHSSNRINNKRSKHQLQLSFVYVVDGAWNLDVGWSLAL